MKKFVSLVLVLALALSLCTVAMAATTETSTTGGASMTVVSTDKWDIYLVNADTTGLKDLKLTTDSKTAWTKTVVEDGEKTVTSIPAYYAFEGVAGYFVETIEDCADVEIYKNGKFVTYAFIAVDTSFVTADGYDAAKVVDKDDDNCGGYTADALVDGDDAYALVKNANKVKTYVVDGKFAFAGTAVAKVPHTFLAKNVTYKDVTNENHGVPVSVKCSECGKTFAIIKNTAFRVDKYSKLTENAATTDAMVLDAATYCVVDTVVAAGSSSKTVDSSKTFDAGVAMYVGLSLMSVAGSAVVIGKKKEF